MIQLNEAIQKQKTQVRWGAATPPPKRQDGTEPRGLVQPNRKLKAAEVDDLARRYVAGARLAELARGFGMHEQTVRAHLQRRGVELRGKQVLSSAQVRQLVRRHEAGQTSVQLGQAFGVADGTIRNALRRAGAEVSQAGHHTLPQS